MAMLSRLTDKSKYMYVQTRATSGSRERRTRRPPNGRGPMIFYDRNANFSQFRLRSLLILNIISIEIWQKHTKNEFYFNF